MRVHGGLTNHLRCTSTLPVQITRRVLSESPWLQQLLESARNVIGFADLAIYNLGPVWTYQSGRCVVYRLRAFAFFLVLLVVGAPPKILRTPAELRVGTRPSRWLATNSLINRESQQFPCAHLCNPPLPSHAARAFFAANRHDATSRRTCS